MRDARIVVVGSLNLDLVVPVIACPRPGHTVVGAAPERHLGGKGANQAVAAARAGGRVAMIGRVGTDDAGDMLIAGLAAQGVDASGVSRGTGPSGQALVFVEPGGENAIVIVPGANAELTPDLVDLTRAALPAPGGPTAGTGSVDSPRHPASLVDEPRPGPALIVMQLEIPLATVEAVAARAAERAIPVMLNAAPAERPLPPALLDAVDVLVVNEHEAAVIADAEPSADPAQLSRIAAALCQRGPRRVVITRGAAGLVWHAEGESGQMDAFSVTAIDTTATGDAFCGTLAVCLANGVRWADALRLASAAGALAATRAGAQTSLPVWSDIERLASSS